MNRTGSALGVFRPGALFDGHVLEFAGFKDLGSFQALDEFAVFVAGHDAHTRMLAGRVHFDSLACCFGGW